MNEILEKLKARYPNQKPEDWESVEKFANRMLSQGVSEDDVYNLCKCTEELNPNLDEEVALARMRAILQKYEPK